MRTLRTQRPAAPAPVPRQAIHAPAGLRRAMLSRRPQWSPKAVHGPARPACAGWTGGVGSGARDLEDVAVVDVCRTEGGGQLRPCPRPTSP